MTKVTISDVAKKLGVSAMTVSRVINQQDGVGEPTRQRVLEAVRTLGYQPNGMARGLRASRSLTIGLVVPDITNPFFPAVAQGAEVMARKRGYNMFLCDILDDPKNGVAALKSLEEKQVDGVIVCSSRMSDKQLFPLLGRHRAAVLINRDAPGEVAGVIKIEHALGTRLAVEHLVQRGRKKLAILAGRTGSAIGRARIEGFRTALAVEREEDRAFVIQNEPTAEAGREATRALLAEHSDIDGLVCFNDIVAAGALKACKELGARVPEDVAVIGNDDIPLAQLVTPALTTLRVNKDELGASAVQMLLDRVEGRNRQVSIVFRPELVIRASTPELPQGRKPGE